MRSHVYKPYVNELLAIERVVEPILRGLDVKPHRRSSIGDIRQYLKSKVRNLRLRLFQILDVVTGRAFPVFRGIAR